MSLINKLFPSLQTASTNMGTMQPSSACATVYTGSSTGIGAVGHTVPLGAFGSPSRLPQPTSPGIALIFPPPTGMMATTMYMMPDGTQMPLNVDAAYIQIINDISMQHQMLLNQRHGYHGGSISPPPPPPPFNDGPRMLDGDFSEDEMEKAEQIIAELDSVAA